MGARDHTASDHEARPRLRSPSNLIVPEGPRWLARSIRRSESIESGQLASGARFDLLALSASSARRVRGIVRIAYERLIAEHFAINLGRQEPRVVYPQWSTSRSSLCFCRTSFMSRKPATYIMKISHLAPEVVSLPRRSKIAQDAKVVEQSIGPGRHVHQMTIVASARKMHSRGWTRWLVAAELLLQRTTSHRIAPGHQCLV
jgi:hypothetical protein